MTLRYHEDDEIDAEMRADREEAEVADLRAGYPPSRWTCTCGSSHARGTVDGVNHRCLACGYIGRGGVMDPAPGP